MIIEGTIKDDVTGNPIEGADISTYNPTANACTKIGVTDVSGRYLIDTPNSVPGLVMQKPGYRAVLVDMGSLQDNPVVGLQPFPALAGDAAAAASAVPAGAGMLTKIPWWVWAAGGGALIMSGQKKKMGAAQDYSKFILPAGVVIAGFIVMNKLGLFGPPGPGTTSNNTANAAAVDAAKVDLQSAANAGVTPTISESIAASIANNIFDNATSNTGIISTASQDAIISDLTNHVTNAADYLKIKIAFGTRASGSYFSWCGFLGINCSSYDLDTTIKRAMDEQHLTDVHNFLASKGYNF